MVEEISYVIVTHHSIRKSRTGGIIARLISRTGLDLVRARMYAPSRELADRYVEMIVTGDPNSHHPDALQLIGDYVRKNFAKGANGKQPRVLLLVFRGENAIAKITETVGHIVHER